MSDILLFYISYTALWIIVIFQMFVLLELVHLVSQGRGEIEEGHAVAQANMLQSGTPAPSFEARDMITGRVINSDALLGQYTMLLFVMPNCPACRMAVDEVESMRKSMKAQLVVICRGDASQCREFGTSYLPGVPLLLDEEGSIGGLFKVKGAPSAILLDDNWQVLRYGLPRSSSTLDLTMEGTSSKPKGKVG